jgi:hypothetical protein
LLCCWITVSEFGDVMVAGGVLELPPQQLTKMLARKMTIKLVKTSLRSSIRDALVAINCGGQPLIYIQSS